MRPSQSGRRIPRSHSRVPKDVMRSVLFQCIRTFLISLLGLLKQLNILAQVVELLLKRGANKEHRNVSDYTPLSLAASGGFVNIIKLLLQSGAEINSRTGSKLGISPLMLAAMNGNTAAVKLLLDMGSDINGMHE